MPKAFRSSGANTVFQAPFHAFRQTTANHTPRECRTRRAESALSCGTKGTKTSRSRRAYKFLRPARKRFPCAAFHAQKRRSCARTHRFPGTPRRAVLKRADCRAGKMSVQADRHSPLLCGSRAAIKHCVCGQIHPKSSVNRHPRTAAAPASGTAQRTPGLSARADAISFRAACCKAVKIPAFSKSALPFGKTPFAAQLSVHCRTHQEQAAAHRGAPPGAKAPSVFPAAAHRAPLFRYVSLLSTRLKANYPPVSSPAPFTRPICPKYSRTKPRNKTKKGAHREKSQASASYVISS